MARFWNITEVPGRRPDYMDPVHYRALAKVAAQVRRRTGAVCIIDLPRAQACFGWPRPSGRRDMVLDVCLFRHRNKSDVPNVFHPVFDELSVDDICHALNLARADVRLKERWAAQKATSQAQEEAERSGREAEEWKTEFARKAG
jgi:hypothetical protein